MPAEPEEGIREVFEAGGGELGFLPWFLAGGEESHELALFFGDVFPHPIEVILGVFEEVRVEHGLEIGKGEDPGGSFTLLKETLVPAGNELPTEALDEEGLAVGEAVDLAVAYEDFDTFWLYR